MAFSYLNYARHGLTKLAGLTRLSKTVCEARGNFMKYPQEMIDYYNSVSKVIYSATEVTDVTTAGDLNGFRAMSTAKTESLFKFLGSYQAPIEPARVDFVVPLSVTRMNVQLGAWVEDNLRLKIESSILYSHWGQFLISVAYISPLKEIVSVMVERVGPGDPNWVSIKLGTISGLQGFAKFSDMYVYLKKYSPNEITLVFESFLENGLMSARYSGTVDCWLTKTQVAAAQQPNRLYLSFPSIAPMSAGTFPTTNSKYYDRSHQTRENITGYGWSGLSEEYTDFGGNNSFDLTGLNQDFRDRANLLPGSYEVAVNDLVAIHLMYIIGQDILSEINVE